jgi:poly(ribitol-phosphate) beta-N-acetylglucosaminyltransferase
MRRHFAQGVMHVMRAIAEEPDPDSRAEALARVDAWLTEHYTDRIDHHMAPTPRVVYHLMCIGRSDDALKVALAFEATPAPVVLADAGHAYLVLPLFRDPDAALPDHLFDMTSSLRIAHQLNSLALKDGVLSVSGSGSIEQLDDDDLTVMFVLHERGSGAEITVPTTIAANTTFAVTMDLSSIDQGTPLPHGLWDAYLIVCAEGVERRVRFGAKRAADFEAAAAACAVGQGAQRHLVAAYYTDPHGNLSIDSGTSKRSALKVVNVHWEDAARGSLEVTCDVVYPGLTAGPGRLVFTDEGGRVYSFGVHRHAEVDSMVLHGRMMRSLDAGALPDGVWSVALELELEGVPVSAAVRMPARPARVTWWRRGLPVIASVTKAGRLKVTGFPARVRGALKRRLKRD